jgi:hypothetical protein
VLYRDDNQLDAEPCHEPRHVTRAAKHWCAMQKLRVRGWIVVDDSDDREVVATRVLRLAQQLLGGRSGANKECAPSRCGFETQFADIARREHHAAAEENRQHPVDDEHRPGHVVSQAAEIQNDDEQERAERDGAQKSDEVAETNVVPVEPKHPPSPEDEEAHGHQHGQGHEELRDPFPLDVEVEAKRVRAEIRQREQGDVCGDTHPRATTGDARTALAFDRTRSDHANTSS